MCFPVDEAIDTASSFLFLIFSKLNIMVSHLKQHNVEYCKFTEKYQATQQQENT